MQKQFKVCFLGYTRLTAIAGRVIRDLPESDTEYVLMESSLETQADDVERARRLGCEVFIAGQGAAARFITEYDLPLVEISVQSIDYAAAVKKAKTAGGKRIAIALHRFASPIDVELLSELMEVPVETIVYEESQELYDLVSKSGCDTIIGASLSNDAAAAAGKKYVMLYAGSEAIREACLRGADMARKLYVARRNQQISKAVLNNSRFGIIITDTSGAVELFNRAAQQYTGIAASEIKGRGIDEFIPALSVERLISGEDSKTDSHHLIQGGMMRCIQERIFLGSETTGVLTTIYPEPHNRKKQTAQSGIEPLGKVCWKNLIAKSDGMRALIEKGKEMALTSFPIVLAGEKGTGRETIARCLHSASGRREAPCIVADMAVIPDENAAKAFFGFERGGYSTAGIIATANNGTVILKNLHLATPVVQACLSRVLDGRQVFRPGMDDPFLPDIKFITAATEEEIRSFPADLSFKLNGLRLNVPALRERREDLEGLFQRLLSQNIEAGRTIKFSDEMSKLLKYYSWPGNLSQMEMVCRRYALMLGSMVNPTEKNLYLILVQAIGGGEIYAEVCRRHPSLLTQDTGTDDFIEGVEDLKNLLKYNDTEISRRVGISRTTLWRIKNK